MSVVNNIIDGIKKIGSADVAPINKSTLPSGWQELSDFSKKYNNGKTMQETALGKSKYKMTKQDMMDYLTEDYSDNSMSKYDLWKNILPKLYDEKIDDLNNNDGNWAAKILQYNYPSNPKQQPFSNVYMNHSGTMGEYDTELSDRLGIGKSTTPMMDVLPFDDFASGEYHKGIMGIDKSNILNDEYGIGTTAHERLHSMQYAQKNDYNDSVIDAINKLRDDLKPYYHNNEQIAKDHPVGKDLAYWSKDIEQEARMFEDYLRRNNYIKDGGHNEYGSEIDPSFDKFLNTLRALSKNGIALPAIAGVGGMQYLLGNNDGKEQ